MGKNHALSKSCCVAIVQMDSRDDIAANLRQAVALMRRAARRGADFVLLPENALYIGPDTCVRFTTRSPEIRHLVATAKALKIWLLIGSIAEADAPDGPRYNTTLLYDPTGRLRARYRKIHLFRCRMPDGGWLREQGMTAGNQLVVTHTPWGRLGLTICYDLRMPELFGQLAARGAQMIAVPANFTAYTGRSHWHTLLRARAIENQCYILAPAQCGDKYHTASYGHALIVDPWGKIIAEASTEKPTVLIQTIDLAQVAAYRKQLPALQDRFAAMKRVALGKR